jgi:molybdate transport system substrate-binding protein
MFAKSIASALKVAPGIAFLSFSQAALSADIHGLGLESLMPSIQILMPDFQRTTGHKVTFNYGNSSTLPKRLDSERFDVAFASTPLMERLVKQGKLAADSQINVARVAIGVGVKKGAPKPDISTTDAFKRALLNAKSISHASEGPSGVYLQNLLKRLGIAAEVQPKLRPVAGGPLVMGPVSKGEVELGIITVPFIVLDKGADLVGALPDELQEYVVYAGGVSSTTTAPEAAQALVRFVASPAAAAAHRSQGLDPMAR